MIAFSGAALVVAWAIIATAILLMDSIGSGNFREQAKRDQRTYETRLNILSSERDARAAEALAAQERFNSALEQISVMQSQLLQSETRRREMETGIEVIQSTLQRTMREREAARLELAALKEQVTNGADGNGEVMASGRAAGEAIDFLSDALAETALQRGKARRGRSAP